MNVLPVVLFVAPVAELAYAPVSETVFCGFESHSGYQGSLVQWQNGCLQSSAPGVRFLRVPPDQRSHDVFASVVAAQQAVNLLARVRFPAFTHQEQVNMKHTRQETTPRQMRNRPTVGSLALNQKMIGSTPTSAAIIQQIARDSAASLKRLAQS